MSRSSNRRSHEPGAVTAALALLGGSFDMFGPGFTPPMRPIYCHPPHIVRRERASYSVALQVDRHDIEEQCELFEMSLNPNEAVDVWRALEQAVRSGKLFDYAMWVYRGPERFDKGTFLFERRLRKL